MIYLCLSGFHGSRGEHWLAQFIKDTPNAVEVQQKDWEHPDRTLWTEALKRDLLKYQKEEIILVAHSMGAVTIAALFEQEHVPTGQIKGVLLVAPADSEQTGFPIDITGFNPMPTAQLPFRSMLISSENDHYMTLERAQYFGEKWGSAIINYGKVGHITTDSGFGKWEELPTLLDQL